MKILISAAETSSDQHGAQLLLALRKKCEQSGERLEAFGIGGPALQKTGLRAVVDARKLLSMGFTEILGRLPTIFRALKDVADAAERERPDLAVVIDYPDFHFRLAKRLKRLEIPVIYFIPPKVWAWRKGRINLLRERFVKILSILPFEVDFYRRENLPVSYVGNPLLDELPLKMTREQAREKLGITQDAIIFLMMPGSRPTELKYHLKLMLVAGRLASAEIERKSGKRPIILMPLPLAAEIPKVDAHEFDRLELRISQGDAHLCMLAADAALIKSGTSTLEAGILGCVHSIIYRSNLLTHFIFHAFIRYPGPVGLVNLVYGWTPGKPYLIREILHHFQTPEELSTELLSLYETERAREIRQGLLRVREKMLEKTDPSASAAQEVYQWLKTRS